MIAPLAIIVGEGQEGGPQMLLAQEDQATQTLFLNLANKSFGESVALGACGGQRTICTPADSSVCRKPSTYFVSRSIIRWVLPKAKPCTESTSWRATCRIHCALGDTVVPHTD